MTRDNSSQTLKITSELLKDLRSLNVAVFHPRDNDGAMLLQQLERIGCKAELFWPPRPELPELTDLIFLSIGTDIQITDYTWFNSESCPPIIAVVAFENPTIVNLVLKIGAKGVVASPIREFGLLSSMVIARQCFKDITENRKRVQRLERRVAGVAKVYEAKKILMDTKKISEDEAYSILRDQAKSKRVEIEVIAETIIYAQSLLNLK
jgi:AmiR/NasT family two-component response regulator